MTAICQRIEAAEQESFYTGEVCGQPGTLREGDWIKSPARRARERTRSLPLIIKAARRLSQSDLDLGWHTNEKLRKRMVLYRRSMTP